jgi:DUF1365 family protein
MASSLYPGAVMHRRMTAPRRRFVYGVFSMLIDLDELPALDATLRLFSYNRRNLVSFHDADHGACDGSKPRVWIEALLAERALDWRVGQVHLLCFPRLFGYVFNPLSIFFCRDETGVLRGILYDVRNTFGDKHGYFIEVSADRKASAKIMQSCAKIFHVSPFLPLFGTYHFWLNDPADTLSIAIRNDAEDGSRLIAIQTGRREVLSDRNLARAIIRHPLMTLKVTAAIHWQALFLWLRGARFHPRPTPPEAAVSFVEQPGKAGL